MVNIELQHTIFEGAYCNMKYKTQTLFELLRPTL